MALKDDIKLSVRFLKELEREIRTCPCGRVCRSGETFIRHRERCKVPFVQDPIDETSDLIHEERVAATGRTLATLFRSGENEDAPVPGGFYAMLLVGAFERFLDTIEQMGGEVNVEEALRSMPAELIRLQYEVP